MAERIVVAVRVRPLNGQETAAACASVAHCDGSSLVMKRGGGGGSTRFQYDHVYGPDSPNAALFDDLGGQVLRNAWLGYNASVFAYGQVSAHAQGFFFELWLRAREVFF